MIKKTGIVLILIIIPLGGFSQVHSSVIKISKNLELIKINDNAYVHVSYVDLPDYGHIGANGLIFINNNEAFLFDSPWTDSLTRELVSFIFDSLRSKVVGFIPNHWHEDCMGGLRVIQHLNIDSYANRMTVDIAKSNGLPVPEHGFNESMEIKLGDKLICCYYPGAAHALDNIVIWIPSEKILFPGCIVKSLDSRNLGNVADGDLKAYPVTIDKLIDKFADAKIVIPGHGRIGGMELLRHTRELAGRE